MRLSTKAKRLRRVRRLRRRVFGRKIRPRLAVFRSNKHITAQLINDETGETMATVSDRKLKGTKKEKAAGVGKLLAQAAKKHGVTKVVFDRRHYRYHGRVAALAENARKEGLEL